MAARRRQKQDFAAVATTKQNASTPDNNSPNTTVESKDQEKKQLDEQSAKLEALKDAHLAPLFLILTVLVCSGILWVMALRDLVATGKIIAGPMDEAMLVFTKSMAWYDDSKGWKSTQGGFSAIKSVSTDENDMGGFFIRKAAGAAALTFHSQKLMPLLFHSADAHFGLGHFGPMLATSVLGNIALAGFYASYMEDLKGAGAGSMSFGIVAVLIVEALVMLTCLLPSSHATSNLIARKIIPEGKTATSIVNRIVMRSVCIISGLISLISARDLFFPGKVIGAIPRDDLYLEWTNTFLHSPPSDSEEAEQHGIEAPLFVGDKFVSQLLALYLLINCFQKFATAFLIRVGKDGNGETKCKIIWKVQAMGDLMLTFVFRVFQPAASTASVDLRWHLMMLGYETFILGLNAFY